jgi:hypothetical protein
MLSSDLLPARKEAGPEIFEPAEEKDDAPFESTTPVIGTEVAGVAVPEGAAVAALGESRDML